MPEETQSTNTNFADLNAVLTEQQKTIKTLTDQLKEPAPTIYNTSPTTNIQAEKPKNYLLFIGIGVGIYFLFKMLKKGSK